VPHRKELSIAEYAVGGPKDFDDAIGGGPQSAQSLGSHVLPRARCPSC